MVYIGLIINVTILDNNLTNNKLKANSKNISNATIPKLGF